MNNEQDRTAEMARVLNEARALLQDHRWTTSEGLYVRGHLVSVLIMPVPAEQTGRVDVPITVSPLIGSSKDLAETPFVLHNTQIARCTWVGRLNRRGQVLFRDLEPGLYQAEIVARMKAAQSVPLFTPLPQLHWRYAAAASTSEEQHYTYRNASGSLIVTLHEAAPGDTELHFESNDQGSTGALVGFRWSSAGTAPCEILAPLAWSESRQRCVARLKLDRLPERLDDVSLLEQHLPTAILPAFSPEIVRESVRRAGTSLTLRAWQQLVKQHGDALPEDMRAAIREALAAREGQY